MSNVTQNNVKLTGLSPKPTPLTKTQNCLFEEKGDQKEQPSLLSQFHLAVLKCRLLFRCGEANRLRQLPLKRKFVTLIDPQKRAGHAGGEGTMGSTRLSSSQIIPLSLVALVPSI